MANRHCHAIEQASRRWRIGRRGDSGRTRRKFDFHTGHYELFAIVTHKGRSADGGHYMGWVKREDGSWLVFDDDLVSESSWEFVQGLKGGGDEHMSYLQFYRAKKGGI